MLCHVFPQRSQEHLQVEYSNLSSSAALASQRLWHFLLFGPYPSVSSFCLQNARPPSTQFWRCAPEEDIPTQDQGGDA